MQITMDSERYSMKLSPDQWLLVALFPICSLAGLAALLRENKPPTKLEVASAVLNSGLFGCAVAALLIHYFGGVYWALILGVSVLAGLGGNVLIVFSLATARRRLSSVVEKWGP